MGCPRRLSFVLAARAVVARLRQEDGDSMIEVTIAMLIVGLISVAIFTSLTAVSDIQGAQRHQSVAIYLAQQDQQRLRGLTAQQLTSTTTCPATPSATIPQTGNGCYTKTYNGETYTVTSSAAFYTASSTSLSCTTSSQTSADYVPITSVVTWGPNNTNDSRKPVQEHGIVTPAAGGQIVASVTDSAGSSTVGLSNVAVTITGPGTSTATQTLTTDANGCAIFVGETPGAYTVSETLPSPYVVSGPSTDSVSVTNGGSAQAPFDVAQPATVNVGFTTQINGATAQSIPFDTFSLEPNGNSSEASYGTAGTYVSPPSKVTTGATVFPYGTGQNYGAFAGACAADDPNAAPPNTSVLAADGATTSATVKVPSMLLGLTSSFTSAGATTEVDDTNASVTYAQGTGSSNGWTPQTNTPLDYGTDERYSNVAGNTASYTFTGTSITWVTKLFSNHGYADVYIDGNDVAHNINTYSASAVYQYQAFTYVWPTSGSHTIKIVVDSGTPTGSQGTYSVVDAFIVGTNTQTQVPNTSSSITYTGPTWGTYTNAAEYSGSERNNSNAGSTATLTFTGTSVAWITSEWPDHGYADVYIDGSRVAQNVDTYAPSATFQVEALQESWASSGTHTIEVYVDGTHDGASTGSTVSLDEFIVTSPATAAAVTSWPSGWSIVTYDSCTPAVERFPTNPAATTVASSQVFPVAAPYGASTQVCIANSSTSTNTGMLPSSGAIANTDFTGSTVTPLTLPTTTSATGASVKFGNSGGCPP
jgi:Tfp pilus assembly protein PilV